MTAQWACETMKEEKLPSTKLLRAPSPRDPDGYRYTHAEEIEAQRNEETRNQCLQFTNAKRKREYIEHKRGE